MGKLAAAEEAKAEVRRRGSEAGAEGGAEGTAAAEGARTTTREGLAVVGSVAPSGKALLGNYATMPAVPGGY